MGILNCVKTPTLDPSKHRTPSFPTFLLLELAKKDTRNALAFLHSTGDEWDLLAGPQMQVPHEHPYGSLKMKWDV